MQALQGEEKAGPGDEASLVDQPLCKREEGPARLDMKLNHTFNTRKVFFNPSLKGLGTRLYRYASSPKVWENQYESPTL